MKSYLSVKQVYARLNGAVSLRQIYASVARGKLRVSRAFGKVLIEEESLSALLEASADPPADPPRGETATTR
jgi:hypothetical protein